MKKNAWVYFLTGLVVIVSSSLLKATMEVQPTQFDFGWVPDNSIISCDFKIKNTGSDLLSLTSIQPSCGCTATNFTPASLSSAQEKIVNMTFNTRGYNGISFDKSVKVTGGSKDEEYVVHLRGIVNDSNAKVIPQGNGVCNFDPSTKSSKQVIQVMNKSGEDVKFVMIQAPSEWASVSFPDKSTNGKSSDVEVTVKNGFDEVRQTSVTLEAKGTTTSHRFTLAIRTGPQVEPPRINLSPASPASSTKTNKN